MNSDLKDKLQIEQMFDSIAGRYDFLNHFLSLGIDKLWRKKAVRTLKRCNPSEILDVATGTGDFAIQIAKLRPDKIIGLDLSGQMLKIGEEKVKRLRLDNVVSFCKGDSENIPFIDESFDAVTVAFGVRNFENLNAGLLEFYRVLKQGGSVVILEFSKPKFFPFKQLYRFYFFYVLPFIGRLVSGYGGAYEYLPHSVMAFPDDQDFLRILSEAGFTECRQRRLTLGVATIYEGRKKV